MPRSLSSRLIISASAALFVISAVALGTLAAIFNWNPHITLELELRRSADHVVRALQFDPNGAPSRVELPQPLKNVYDVLRSDAVYRLLDPQGKVLLASDGAMTPLAPQGEALVLPPAGERKFALAASSAGVMLHVLTREVTHEGRHFYIQVGRSERFHEALFNDKNSVFRKATIFAVLIAMLVFIGTVWCTFRHTLRPLRRASEAASLIESNNLNARLSINDMPQELLPLMDAFNKALDRLELGYRAQQEFLGTVAPW
jgi:two-component system sensor histidine kinase QseC